MILAEHLRRAADQLVPPDHPVMVHTSMRSFEAPISGGADGLLDALLASGRTVLAPTFTEPQFGVAAPAALQPARNGIDYTTLPAASGLAEGTSYTVDCGLINPSLGVLPAALISRPGVVRGTHPLNSFAALGPLADKLISAQNLTNVYGPIRELAARDGLILLIGVGLNRMTALHLAEQQSGRSLFMRWAQGTDGHISMVEVGSCSEGFPRLGPALRPHCRSVTVGRSQWRAYPAPPTLAAATAAIAANQDITRCSDSDCLLCRDSIAGGPAQRYTNSPRRTALINRIEEGSPKRTDPRRSSTRTTSPPPPDASPPRAPEKAAAPRSPTSPAASPCATPRTPTSNPSASPPQNGTLFASAS